MRKDILTKVTFVVLIVIFIFFVMFKQLGYSEKYKSDGVELHIRNSRYPKMIGGFSRYNEYQFTEFYNFDRYLFSHIAPEIKQIDVDEENK